MTVLPLVTAIVPTWHRAALLTKCLPSIAAQTYPRFQCVVVSDGPDEDLQWNLELRWPLVRTVWLETHGDGLRTGNEPRAAAVNIAEGEYVAFCDDDDTWEPRHLSLVMDGLLANPEIGFGYGMAMMHLPGCVQQVIGTAPPTYGGITTSAIVARTDLCRRINWGDESAHGDWDLVSKWLADGQMGVMSEEVSVHIYPASLGVVA